MNVLIYGLGAVGTVFATFLKEGGNQVYAVTKPKYKKQIKNNEIFVDGIWGKHSAKLDGIYTSTTRIKNIDFDLIIISVKSYDTEKAILSIKELVKKDTFILLAQNGYGNYEIAKKYLPAKQLLLARVIFGSKILEPGYAYVTVNADDVIIGQPENLADENKVKEVVEEINKSGIPTSYSTDVYKILWDKILYNCALNPLGAILETTYGNLAENEETRQIMDKIIDEIFLVTKKNKIKLRWRNSTDFKKFFYEKLIPPTKEHFPSMYYDIKSGKKTEIDALNGAIVKLAEEAKVEVPVNKTITSLVKAKSEGISLPKES